ncbi:MAG: hypothetical protein HC892_17760 [Saprospiraceae bacterium]|nr:hypothetical protein [Saprospiraceae bacterium]
MLTCIQCGQKMTGRADKKYCSDDCKNKYHQTYQTGAKSEVAQVDKILHRNRQILATIMGEKRNKFTLARLDLDAMGFNFKYITGIYTNSQGKLYHYVYDFAWMEFSSQEVMIVRKK